MGGGGGGEGAATGIAIAGGRYFLYVGGKLCGVPSCKRASS